MDKDYVKVTHANEDDYETFRKSIDSYDNPTYDWQGRVESSSNYDGSVETLLERDSIKDFGRLGEDVKLTGGDLEIGTED